MLGFMAFRLLIKDKVSPSTSRKRQPTTASGRETAYVALKKHLRTRYGPFWRRKVHLLLVVGDAAAIEQLVPGLQAQRWLEGSRTVLIYGGGLASDPDREQLSALRRLRRGRPLDGVVRVLNTDQSLTPQLSDSDLRGLEKIGDLLRYQPAVWLWQLCSSDWPQAGRQPQAVGITLPARGSADEAAARLGELLPQLRAQGLAQVAENRAFDFLLRLAQRLEQGDGARWKNALTPWLYGAQRRVPLRGLMFSLPGAADAQVQGSKESAAAARHPHGLRPDRVRPDPERR